MPLKVYFCAPENIRGNIGEMAMRNCCLAMSFSESFMDYRSVVIELPLGNHTTTRWYTRYHSMVFTLPFGGTHATARWYSPHLSVFNFWILESREFSFFAGYRNDSEIH